MPHLVDVAKTLLKRYRAFGWICWRALGRVELLTNGLGILQLYVVENTSTDKGHAVCGGLSGKLRTNYLLVIHWLDVVAGIACQFVSLSHTRCRGAVQPERRSSAQPQATTQG